MHIGDCSFKAKLPHWYGCMTGVKPAVCLLDPHWAQPRQPPAQLFCLPAECPLAPMHKETSFHPSLLSLPGVLGPKQGGAKGLWDDWGGFLGMGPLGRHHCSPESHHAGLRTSAQELTLWEAPGPSPSAPPASSGWVKGPPSASQS